MTSIEGVLLTPLKVIADERGSVMHFMSQGRAPFVAFGEAYFSGVNPGVTKGWKTHTTTTGNLAVVSGVMQFVLIDRRPDSATFEERYTVILSPKPEEYQLLTIPPGVTYAWRNLADTPSLVANLSSEPWRAEEAKTEPIETYEF